MLRKLVEAFALISALAGPVSAASVELSPVGERVGQTVYALALAGDIKSGDDLRVASLLGKALVEERFPGYIVLSSNGGNTSASLGIARIAHTYGIPVVVGAKCLSACAIIALSAWRGRLFVVRGRCNWTASVLGRHEFCEDERVLGANAQRRDNIAFLRRAQVGHRENDANTATGHDILQRC